MAPPPARRRAKYAAAALAAGVLGATLVTVSVLAARGEHGARGLSAGAPVAGAVESDRLFRGIQQQGGVLGAPDAPVTLVEYADLQCPYCAQWAGETLPVLVREYVRRGDVKVVFRGLAFIGPDSETALRAAVAAGKQRKLWNVVHLLYATQGGENTGWVDDETLSAVLRAVPGLDGQRVFDDRFTAPVDARLRRDTEAAQLAGIEGTPSFFVGVSGGRLSRLEVDGLGPAEFRPVLDELLRR